MTNTELSPWGSGVTEGEPAPTPTPHTVGWEGGRGKEPTRAGARARARLSLPEVPQLVAGLFVGDSPHPFTKTVPRMRRRLDYALRGEWTAPPLIDAKGRPHYSNKRLIYAALTLLIACPVAVAIDVVEWLTFPLGRLAISAIVLFILFVSL